MALCCYAAIKWEVGEGLKATEGNALASTLQSLYQGRPGYLLYNDEWPNGTTSSYLAHAKGEPATAQAHRALHKHYRRTVSEHF
jgi:hypothetical protein